MNRAFSWVAVLAALVAAGCVAPNHRTEVLDSAPRPTRAVEDVEVLHEEPERAYHVIAMFTGEEESVYGEQSDPLRDKARARAAELGADAIIVVVTVDNGLPVQMPSMIPGVATGGLETTSFEVVTRLEARIVVWLDGPSLDRDR